MAARYAVAVRGRKSFSIPYYGIDRERHSLSDVDKLCLSLRIALDEPAVERHFQTRSAAVIVCLCHGVRDRDIDAVIGDGAESIDDVGEQCGAGTGCGACIPDIEDKLERAGRGCDRSRAGDCPRGLVTLRSAQNDREPRDAA
ncbi:MAG TPA: (2Fe-2S)-binding protein [Kofleriaceae bacterium]|nr:(2Fe-2S)-binding protein [Kofleriaceae bacterium]